MIVYSVLDTGFGSSASVTRQRQWCQVRATSAVCTLRTQQFSSTRPRRHRVTADDSKLGATQEDPEVAVSEDEGAGTRELKPEERLRTAVQVVRPSGQMR